LKNALENGTVKMKSYEVTIYRYERFILEVRRCYTRLKTDQSCWDLHTFDNIFKFTKIRNEKTFSIEARKITCKTSSPYIYILNSLFSVLRTHSAKVVERHKRLI